MIKNKILYYFAILLLNNTIQSMQDAWEEFAVITAAQALKTGGNSRNVETLRSINEKNIKNVKRLKLEKTEAYTATIDNDTLICELYHSGQLKGQISCSRNVRSGRGGTLQIPIDSEYFYILKSIAEQNNSN